MLSGKMIRWMLLTQGCCSAVSWLRPSGKRDQLGVVEAGSRQLCELANALRKSSQLMRMRVVSCLLMNPSCCDAVSSPRLFSESEDVAGETK